MTSFAELAAAEARRREPLHHRESDDYRDGFVDGAQWCRKLPWTDVEVDALAQSIHAVLTGPDYAPADQRWASAIEEDRDGMRAAARRALQTSAESESTHQENRHD